MARFETGQRVVFRQGGTKYRGRVTRVGSRKRGVVTDDGRRLTVAARALKPSLDRALILETRLERNLLRNGRVYGPMMQQWLSALDVETLYERVHTVDDVRGFLAKEGKNVSTRFVHFMGHGADDCGAGKARLCLTFADLDLDKQRDVFAGLTGKIIVFSCCDVGADATAMRAVKEASGAAAVIAYRKGVRDWYTNLAEGMLYERLVHDTSLKPARAVALVNDALQALGVRLPDEIARKPVLVCF